MRFYPISKLPCTQEKSLEYATDESHDGWVEVKYTSGAYVSSNVASMPRFTVSIFDVNGELLNVGSKMASVNQGYKLGWQKKFVDASILMKIFNLDFRQFKTKVLDNLNDYTRIITVQPDLSDVQHVIYYVKARDWDTYKKRYLKAYTCWLDADASGLKFDLDPDHYTHEKTDSSKYMWVLETPYAKHKPVAYIS